MLESLFEKHLRMTASEVNKAQNVVIDTILVSLWATVNLFKILILLVAFQEY